MKNKWEENLENSLNSYEKSGDFDQLWNELEPRLPRKKTKRLWPIVFLFFGLSTSIFGFLWLTKPSEEGNLASSQNSTIENEITMTNSKNSVEKVSKSLPTASLPEQQDNEPVDIPSPGGTTPDHNPSTAVPTMNVSTSSPSRKKTTKSSLELDEVKSENSEVGMAQAGKYPAFSAADDPNESNKTTDNHPVVNQNQVNPSTVNLNIDNLKKTTSASSEHPEVQGTKSDTTQNSSNLDWLDRNRGKSEPQLSPSKSDPKTSIHGNTIPQSEFLRITSLPTLSFEPILIGEEDPYRYSLSSLHSTANVQPERTRPWSLFAGAGVSNIIASHSSNDQLSPVGQDQRSSLNYLLAKTIEVGADYQVNHRFFARVGVGHISLVEEFEHQGVIDEYEESFFDEEAFQTPSGDFIGAERTRTVTETRSVFHYNDFQSWQVRPGIGYRFGNKVSLTGQVYALINLSTSYRGKLLDDNGQVGTQTSNHTRRSMSSLGYGINLQLQLPEIGSWSPYLGIHAESQKMNSADFTSFSDSQLLLTGLHLGIRYRL